MTLQNNTFHDDPELSGEESAILARILTGELDGDLEQDKIRPRDVYSPLPQSFSQQRLWILDRLVPGSAFYNLPSAIRLKGQLDAGVLERSLNEVIRRHESLRTVFSMVDEEPVQVILPELKLSITPIDLGGLSPAEQESEVSRRLEEEARTPFDLQRGPLLRVILLRLGTREHVLLYNMHHIISDSWSMDLFVKELSILHSAFSRGESSPLPAPPAPGLQYGDYAVWQRQRLKGETLEKQLSYWRELLSGDLPVLELPTDRQRPAVSTYRGGVQFFTIPEPLTTKLLEFNRKENCSLFMTLLAAFNVLLYRYSGQEDILVGSPIANRNRAELEEIIGFFANTLVYRTDLSGNPSFRRLLDQVREMTTRAYDNQDIPFEKLVEELQPQRFMSHNPLFQVMFVLQNVPRQTVDVGSLEIQDLSPHSGTSKFDLWLSVTQYPGTLAFAFEYSYDIFIDSTVTRLFGHFQALLQAITRDPGCGIHLLEILPDEEKKRLLIDFNNTDVEYPGDKTLHELFAEQAEKTPDLIAVIVGPVRPVRPVRLTYSELNEQSSRWAQLLVQKGVEPDTIVAVMLERSIEMVMSLMAILKAGGAYLPIDPEYPQERVDYMLKDSGARILVSRVSEVSRGIETIDIHKFKSKGDFLTHLTQHTHLTQLNLAYIIYTSGSTGEPKGAMISHEGIVNRLYWMQETFCLNSDDRVLQKTPYSFDVSVWEFFWPLLTGAGLVTAVPGGHKDCAYLVQAIIREKITTIHFVPSVLQVFLEEPGVSAITSLKRVICSGEALPPEYRERFFALFDKVELHNLYGPTEASVDVTAWPCERNSHRHMVPIGRPIANTQIYILDKNLQPVPIGVQGELYIGGIQLARGYINRPGLTAEKFIKNYKPYKSYRSYRSNILYRTGDLVRWQEDGSIEFLGRLDFQVKVRGFRIELGEIESRLREHDAVHDAVVLVAGDDGNTGGGKLTAYVVPCRDYRHLPADQVDDWEGVFDETYTNDPGRPDRPDHAFTDPEFNIAGWNSSYTGEPIPAAEMKEWVDRTTERILSPAPQRILEIGCGTGLFLFRLIRRCRYYVGTDIAKQGLDYIRRQLDQLTAGKPGQKDWAPVELLHRSAENFEGMADRDLDMIIMNSVSQYFPSAEYLVEVLSKAVQNLKPGGHIFIGDVRSLPLLKTFHASVEFSRAGDGDMPRQVLGRVMNKLTAEQELVVEPRFFTALKTHLPKIKQVELLLKYGRYCNELSKFRYDAILHIGNGHGDCNAGDYRPEFTLDWEVEKPGLEGIRQWLNGLPGEPGVLAIRGVWNPRVSVDFQVLKWLTRPGGTGTVGEFRRYLAEQKNRGIAPDDFLQLAEEFPYRISAVIPVQGEAHAYDVIFRRRRHRSRGESEKAAAAGPIEIHPWYSYTNNPLLRKMTGELVPQLREYLKEHLPEYMTPSHFIFLDSLPLTANGKLDRGALPLYEPSRTALEQENEFSDPRTGTERMLIEVWKELLLLDKVSIHDNFFQLGGDSINAIQMISRINKKGFNLSVSHLYRNMTVAELARYIDTHWQEVTVPGKERQEGIPALELKITREEVQRRLPAGVAVEDVYPLTPLQKHMLDYYLRDKQEEGVPGLFVNQVRIRAALDMSHIPLLRQTFQHLTEVYPYLRTAFMWEDIEEPVQVVHKNAPVDIQYFDWSHLPPGEQDRRIEDFLARDHYRGFERDNPTGDRTTIIALSPSQSLIIKTSDLMRVDGWSAMIITTKLFEYMQGLSTGQAQKLEPDANYREYISWLSAQDQAKGKNFWQAMIRGCPAPTPIVECAPRNQDRDGRKEEPGFHCRYIYLSRRQTTELNNFLKQNKIVLSALACGIWALLLWHYTGHERVIFGILFSGRGAALAGVEFMIGQAINILPMRIDLTGGASILTWLHQVWDTLTALQPYEVNQQDKIREWWGRPPGRPLFESYLVMENFPGAKERSKIDDSGRPNLEYIAQMEYPLRVEFEPGPELGLLMQYYRCHFTDNSIASMLNDVQTLLLEIIKNPDQKVGDLEELIQRQSK